MLVGTVVGAASAVSIGGLASYQALKPQYAEVVSVEPVRQAQSAPEHECQATQVTHRRPVQDEHRIAGTVLGGVVGGVIGHQFGGGTGQDIATIAGAAAGGFAGNQVQKNLQDTDTYTATEQRCRTVKRTVGKVVGYQVKYVLDGHLGTVQMDHRPGDRIPVKHGQLMLNEGT
jgi:uncharacterized protein YcfJ